MTTEQHATATGTPYSRLEEARKQIRIANNHLDDSDLKKLEQALDLIEDVQSEPRQTLNDD